MSTLHLTHQGGKLRLQAGRLVLTDPEGAALSSVPARKVRRVVVHGNVGLTTPALTFLLKNSGTVHFVSLRGEHYGQAAATSLPSPERIARQLFLSENQKLELARTILSAKVRSQLEYLRRAGTTSGLAQLNSALGEMQAVRDLDKLRGLEGIASRIYFEQAARPLAHLGFRGRRRRPPTDPVNAAISYGYAVLLSLVASALLAAEVHPEIGVFHATGRRRPALALDLMEEFRVPVVDAPVFRAFKRGWINASDTQTEGQAVLLNASGKKKVIEALETRLSFKPSGSNDDYRGVVFKQAERLASAIVHGRPYRGYALSRG